MSQLFIIDFDPNQILIIIYYYFTTIGIPNVYKNNTLCCLQPPEHKNLKKHVVIVANDIKDEILN